MKSFWFRHTHNLILVRSELGRVERAPSERLEGWTTDTVLVPILRDGASRLLRMRKLA
jgi:hypothetical protein